MSITRFSATGRNITRTVQRTTCVGLTSSSSTRGSIYELGCTFPSEIEAPPMSCVRWVVGRYRAPGICTAVSPVKFHRGSPSALLAPGERHLVEPAYLAAATLLDLPLHPRATWHWYASPGSEILIPATGCDGVGIASFAPTSGEVAEAVVHWEES